MQKCNANTKRNGSQVQREQVEFVLTDRSFVLRAAWKGERSFTTNHHSFAFHLLSQTELARLQVWSGLQVMVPLPLAS